MTVRAYRVVWLARELLERAYFLDLLDVGDEDDFGVWVGEL